MLQVFTTLQIASKQVSDLLTERHRTLRSSNDSGLEAAAVAIIAVAVIAAAVAIGGIITVVVQKYGGKLSGA